MKPAMNGSAYCLAPAPDRAAERQRIAAAGGRGRGR